MKKGIRGHDVRAKGLTGIASKAKENQIEYLQLVLEKSIDGFLTGEYSEAYAMELKNQLQEMQVAILGSYINPSNPDEEALRTDIEKFKEKIKYASVLEPIAVGTETGIYKEGMTDSEEAYQWLLKTVRELVAEGEKYGVNIGIEGVHCLVINTPQKMKRLIDDVNSDRIKVIFDPVNLITIDNYQKQDEIIRDMFSLLSDKICVVHAKDLVLEDGAFRAVVPTKGLLNYQLILEQMKEYGLDIPIICEEINEADACEAFRCLEQLI